MKYSKLFGKPTKNQGRDLESVNAELLIQGGFIHQEMAGVYTWLPLGLKVLRKVENIIREELNKIEAQEILMPALQSKDNWLISGRWNSVDILFKLPSQTKKEYALGATHEEVVTPLIADYVKSYKDLPVAVYQIQTKFRDELRAKSGILRGREFGMNDLYSFHKTQEDFDEYYKKVQEAYFRIFTRLGLEVKMVEASGGDFTKKYSHEFHVLTSAGEDDILACDKCSFAQNVEIATLKEGDKCPKCGSGLKIAKGVEIGNIFDLNTKFTDVFKVRYTDQDGSLKIPLMGCYGIGTTRLVGAIVESNYDDKGIIWPKEVSAYDVHLVSLSSRDDQINNKIKEVTQNLYKELQLVGYSVFWDDREKVSVGNRLKVADLLGFSIRVLVSEKSLRENEAELSKRGSDIVKMVKVTDLVNKIKAF